MKAIILAAGMGNRLGKFTQDNTKCMVEVDGKKLLNHALDAIKEKMGNDMDTDIYHYIVKRLNEQQDKINFTISYGFPAKKIF